MAIQFAQDAKNRIAAALANSYAANIIIFPNSVPFPSAYFLTAISGFVIRSDSLSITRTNNRISSNVRTVTSSQSGTLGWFIVSGANISGNTLSISNGRFISDSIGLSGSGSLLTVNTMDISPGTVLTMQFNLSII